MKTTKNDSTQKMATLAECINNAVKDGYTTNFTVDDNGLTMPETKKHFKPSEIAIPNFYRFEGYSDPEDNSILYIIETTDGTKGTLVSSYGTDADSKISSFIKKVEDIRKKEAQ